MKLYSRNLYLDEFLHVLTGAAFGFFPYCWLAGVIYACVKEFTYDPQVNCIDSIGRPIRWLWKIPRFGGQGLYYEWAEGKSIWMKLKGWLDWSMILLGIFLGIMVGSIAWNI